MTGAIKSDNAGNLVIAIAQHNTKLGDINANASRIIASAQKAKNELKANIIVFPELTLCGYPPEDLLLRPSLKNRIDHALAKIKSELSGIDVVIGAPITTESGDLKNSALVIRDGNCICLHHKQNLPNYLVFDEHRYFTPGNHGDVALFKAQGISIGLAICEDLWDEQLIQKLKLNNVEIVLSLNASPFTLDKQRSRQEIIKTHCVKHNLSIIYVNQVGAQDELIFDGHSFVVNPDGTLPLQLDVHKEMIETVTYSAEKKQFLPSTFKAKEKSKEAMIYDALVLSVKDYVEKNQFLGVIIGLSGGIDSALVLAIATDALGSDRVQAVMMPSKYTSTMSLDDAGELANNFGVDYQVLAIDDIVNAFNQTLAESFSNYKPDTTEENIQSRSRGVLLMALSNKKGALVLTTGNKSEMAVGYATLYGDMVGGFNPLKDVYKTQVYQLANYRNSIDKVIPDRVIERAPSAELSPNQKDSDSLPPYDILDQILALYIEKDLDLNAIMELKSGDPNFSKDLVGRVMQMVDKNEYKRSQAPIGARITSRAFGKDRRYPISYCWPLDE